MHLFLGQPIALRLSCFKQLQGFDDAHIHILIGHTLFEEARDALLGYLELFDLVGFLLFHDRLDKGCR